jgi:hypothetical protein
VVWAPMLLLVGDVIGDVGERLIGGGNTALLVLGVLVLFGIGAVVVAALHWRQS